MVCFSMNSIACIRYTMSFDSFDSDLHGTQLSIRDTAHRFASEVLRPVGQQLDKLSPEEVIADGSPLWDVHRQYRDLGLHAIESAESDMSPSEAAVASYIVEEELGWGDAGLACSLTVSTFPLVMAQMSGNQSLQNRFTPEMIGCWAVTEPNRGSDTLMFDQHAYSGTAKPNCIARKQGDEFLISGQKSAWVSNGSIANCCALVCAVDCGDGLVGDGIFLIELEGNAVSRGKPLDKIGQRPLNQGEIFFDNLCVPSDSLIVPPELYEHTAPTLLCFANTGVASSFAGVARAAYELALDYATQRIQGGAPIVEHQSVKARLFEMFRKIECARALTRRVALYNGVTESPALEYSIAAKVTATQTAFEVASEAFQIFGAAGTSRDYPIEKIFRDARSSLIEDGCNYVLSLKAATHIIQSN